MSDLWFVQNFLVNTHDDCSTSQSKNEILRSSKKKGQESDNPNPKQGRSPPRQTQKSIGARPASSSSRSPPRSILQEMDKPNDFQDDRSSPRSLPRSSATPTTRPTPRRIKSRNGESSASSPQRNKSKSLLKDSNLFKFPPSQQFIQKVNSETVVSSTSRSGVFSSTSDNNKVLGTAIDDNNTKQPFMTKYNSEATNLSIDTSISQKRRIPFINRLKASTTTKDDTQLSSSPPPPPPFSMGSPRRTSFGGSPSDLFSLARKSLSLTKKTIPTKNDLDEMSSPAETIDINNTDQKTDQLKRLVALRKERNSEMLNIDPGGGGHEIKKREDNGLIKSPIKNLKKRNSIKYSDWIYQQRPEIKRNDLRTLTVIDERHDRRCVRCVVWDPEFMFNDDDDEVNQKDNNDNNDNQFSSNKMNQKITKSIHKQRKRKEKFALKISTRGLKDEFCKRVLSEKKIMTALNNQWHAKLVNTYISDHNLYMLLDYYENGSLDQLVENKMRKRLSEKTLMFYAGCVFKGIEHMHKQGIIHRDIKLSNLLIDNDGYLKICDYGLSKFLLPSERTQTYLGTLQYIPPEMISKLPYSHIIDLWSFGICCYEMYYGITPFEPPKHQFYNSVHDDDDDSRWRQEVKNNILTNSLKFPDLGSSPISLNLKLFIRSLLNKDVSNRLGYRMNEKGGVEPKTSFVSYQDIQDHAFFNKFSFTNLERRKITAPPTSF